MIDIYIYEQNLYIYMYIYIDEFKEEHRKAVNRILGEIEWRKIQLQKRMTEEEGRCYSNIN